MRDQVNAFVKDHLPENAMAWCKKYLGKRKIIHDGIWGTFELEPHEVALIDTPLIQRLRYIHQTAGAFWTYPSARHTRFEHSLGVMHQATEMCEKLRRVPSGDKRFEGNDIRHERLAALLHDTGHGPFSHTSERFFSALPETSALLSPGGEFSHSGAGEALSALITTSDPLVRFFKVASEILDVPIDPQTIAKIITGGFDSSSIYLAEPIHGPFDADKLDYMHRDGAFSGLKMFVDIDRLHSSLHIHSYGGETRIAGKVAGTGPLMQILFNKIILTTGMYHHHKVRAVDAMLWAAFDLAYKRGSRIGNRKIQSAIDFLYLTDDYMLIPEICDDEEIGKLLLQVRQRQLWVRALTISRKRIPSELLDATAEANASPWQDFVNLQHDSRENFEERRDIARHIWETADKPCAEHEVCLDVPKRPSVKEANRTWIVDENGGEPLTLKEIVPTGEWVSLYELHLWKAYVFCPPAAQEAIGRASRKVFKDRLGLVIVD